MIPGLYQPPLWWLPNGILYFCHSFPCISWHPTVRNSFPFLSFIHLFILFISVWTCEFLYNPVDCNLLFTLMLKLSVIWSAGTLSSCPFDLSSSLFEHFLTFWQKDFQNHLVLPLPQPWNQPLCQRIWFLLVEDGIFRNQDLVVEVLLATGMLLLLGPLSRESYYIPICINTFTCVYTHTHVYLKAFTSLYVCVCIHTHTHTHKIMSSYRFLNSTSWCSF